MPEANELIDEGKRCENHGVFDRALENFAAAAECSTDPSVIAEALTHQSRVHRYRCEWEEAIATAHRAQHVARGSHLTAALTDALVAEANVMMCRGDFEESLVLFNEVLEMTRDPRMRGIALQNIGSVLAQQGKLGAAERAFAESFGWFRHAGYRLGEAMALNNHARVALDRGDATLAEQLLEEALAAAREEEYSELIALTTLNLAEALSTRGIFDRAEEQASTALGYFATSGNRWREIECLRLIGAINEQCSDYDDAVRCYERALKVAEEIGARQDLHVVRDCLARVRAQTTGRNKGRTEPKRGGDRVQGSS